MAKKILFWIDAELIRLGIIKQIKDNYDCEVYFIIDITDNTKKFFYEQKIIDIKKYWFLHENIKKDIIPDLEYLKKIENYYELNIWLLASNERLFNHFNEFHRFNENEILSIIEQECRFFEKIFNEVKPDVVILPNPVFHFYQIFYHMCKKLNIKILLHQGTRFGKKCVVTKNMESIGFEKHIPKINRSLSEIQKFKDEFNMFEQQNKFRKRFLTSRKKLLSAGIRFFLADYTNNKTHYSYFGRTKSKVLINFILNSIKRKIRKSFIDKNLIKEYNFKKPFIFFPLHIEEEHSLLNVAPFYTNQIEFIKNIVKSIPIGFDLVVKEHPTMYARNWRKISDYKLLKSLPNVRIIHPDIHPDQFIKKSSLVITISGTAAFEASFYEIPSIIFSDTVFSSLPFIKRLKSFEDLPSEIRKSLKTKINNKELNNYIDYIDNHAFDFDIDNFVQDFQDIFQFGGFLVDNEISVKMMSEFLEKHSYDFKKIALEYIKKIEER